MKVTRVGLVGAGWVASHHLAAWQQASAFARVVAIADPDLAKAARLAEEFGIPAVRASAQELLEQCEVDAVDIAAPREFHVPLVKLAAARGLPVLCQKPLAETHAEAVELAVEVEPKARIMVHENWRFRPYYRRLASWIDQGRLGVLHHAHMELLSSGLMADAQGKLPALERQPFIAGLARAMVSEILIHHIDTLRFLLGDLELVHARLGKASTSIKGEDRATVWLQTAAGVPVSLQGDLCVHGAPPALTDRLRIVGGAGSARLDNLTLRLDAGVDSEEARFDQDVSYGQSYASTIRHFLDCLASGAEFETRPADNLKTLRLVEEIYERGGLT